MKPYSVMYDPIIPVLMLNGESKELGIRDVLVNSHKIEKIQSNFPLESYSVLRFLISITMDMIHPDSWRDRKNMYKQGRFDPDVVDEYIVECEKNGPCFNLFDEDHPFMQAAYDPEIDKDALKSVANIILTFPSGNNHVFMYHHLEKDCVLTPAEAFRALITSFTFCTAGGSGYRPGLFRNIPIFTIIEGRNLFETIILNMVSKLECANIEYGEENVPWRNKRTVLPKSKVGNISLLEGLLWQPRRVCLVRDEDGNVRNIYHQPGMETKENIDVWRDIHVALINKEGRIMYIQPKEGRLLWKDIGCFLVDRNNDYYHPPATFAHATDIVNEYVKPLRIYQVGLLSNKMCYSSILEDTLSLPGYVLNNAQIADVVRDDIDCIEKMEACLLENVGNIFGPENKKTKKKYKGTLAEQVRAEYLSFMHDALFTELIPSLVVLQTNYNKEFVKGHAVELNSTIVNKITDIFSRYIIPSCINAKKIQEQDEAKQKIMIQAKKLAKRREKQYE